MNRIRPAAVVAAIAASAIALTGCSFDRGDAADAEAVLNIKGWGDTTWPENFNIFSPTATATVPGTAYVYEPLVTLDRANQNEVKPWLAESWEFDDTGKRLTFTLRDDVTWSDGEAFDTEDVAWTWDLVLSGEANTSVPFDSFEVVDDRTITAVYADQAYSDLSSFRARYIVPEHLWAAEDPASWTNPKPVGTGPFIVDRFSPQQVDLVLNEDYWGQESKGVKALRIRAMNDEAAKAALIAGDVDYSSQGWEHYQEEYIDLNPDTNVFRRFPTGYATGLSYNTTMAPYDDPIVRTALRDALDLDSGVPLLENGAVPPTKAGLNADVWGDMVAPDQVQKQDIDGAKSALEGAGYTIDGGKLVGPDGTAHELQLHVYQPYGSWVTMSQVMADQWKNGLGLNVAVQQLGDQQYSEIIDAGEYAMLFQQNTFGFAPYQYVNQFNSKNIGTPGDNTLGHASFWKNARMDEIATTLQGIQPGEQEAEVKALFQEAQEIITAEAPIVGVLSEGWNLAVNTSRWEGWPEPGKASYIPNPTLPSEASLTVLNLEPR